MTIRKGKQLNLSSGSRRWMFCIQETKIQVLSDRVVSSLGSGRFLDWKALDAFGSAGDILICWDKRSL